MSIFGISFWQILTVLMLAVVLFGSGKIRRLGEDLGGAIGGLRRSVRGDNNKPPKRDIPSEAIAEVSQSGERQ